MLRPLRARGPAPFAEDRVECPPCPISEEPTRVSRATVAQPGAPCALHPETPVSPTPLGSHARDGARDRFRRRVLAGLLFAFGVGGQGCVVRVYQPLSGFHRPVAVDPQHPNFTDTRLNLRCPRGKLLSNFESASLCRKVSTLFVNQGAEVRIFAGGAETEGAELPAVNAVTAPTVAEPRTELTLELRARETDASFHPFSWVAFAATLTLLPGVTESSFEQQVIVRDAGGFLLVSDSMEGRWVSKYGFGAWFGNVLVDLGRKKVDRLGKEAASHDLSNDLYRQLSQDLFNAKMHAQILQQAPPVSRARQEQ